MRRLRSHLPYLPARLPPLLPSIAPVASRAPPPRRPRARTPRRKPAIAACDRCRQRKIKCNAKRPACGTCVDSKQPCTYFTNPSESRGSAWKRKHLELLELVEFGLLLFECFRAASTEDIYEFILRIQKSDDVKSFMEDVRNSTLLLQFSGAVSKPRATYANTFMPNCTSAPPSRAATARDEYDHQTLWQDCSEFQDCENQDMSWEKYV